MVSEKKIIEDCVNGKRYAYEQLFKTYASTMLGICMRYSKDKAEAEDILQEGFIKVFFNIKKFRSEGSFEGWLKKIMVNTAINHYQKNLKHYFHIQIDKLHETISDYVDDDLHADESLPKEKIMALVQDLPDGYRFVFNMYVFEEFSHKQIAKAMNISVSTSKTQLFKARHLLKRKIESIKKEELLYNKSHGERSEKSRQVHL